MSEEQVREFATSIFSDITAYIQTHKEEYIEFLKQFSVDKQE